MQNNPTNGPQQSTSALFCISILCLCLLVFSRHAFAEKTANRPVKEAQEAPQEPPPEETGPPLIEAGAAKIHAVIEGATPRPGIGRAGAASPQAPL